MKKTRATVDRNKAHELGFSLLSTVLLMVLLAVLALGLLSLSTVSLRGSQTAQAQEEAKANARLALLFAIGELQKHAGADQRVTARADIRDALSGAPTLKQPWLTGVWKTEDNPLSDTLGRDLRLKRPQKLPAYLISGNERYRIDPASGSYPSGYMTPDQSLPTGSGNRPGDVEVGQCSWAGNNQPVNAPLMGIQASKGNQGGYAYWVEDEGVKARLDLSNRFDNPTDKAETFAGGALGHRNRVDWIAKGGAGNQPGHTLESLPKTGNDPLFSKLVSMNTVAFGTSDPKAAREDLKRLRSDVTTSSRSLLVDMQRGGFRRDLTAAFRQPNLSSLVSKTNGVFDTELIFPQQGSPNDGENGVELCYRPGGAPWSVLKDYADYATRVNSKSQMLDVRDWLGGVPPAPGSPSKPPFNGRDLNAVSQFYPVLNRVQMLFDVSYEDVGGGNYDVMFHLFPSIVLWNPYDQPMKIPPFRVDIPAKISWSSGTARVEELGFEYTLQPGTFTYVGTPPATNPRAIFKLRFYSGQGVVIPAGKSIILTTPSRHIAYNAGSVAGQELVPQWQDGFGLYIRGVRVKFNNPGAPSRISVAQTDADSDPTNQGNDFGGETRIMSNELGFQLVRTGWDLDGAPPTSGQPTGASFINFIPKVRTAAQPLTSNTPKWGGVLARKCVENQLQPLVTDPKVANAYPAKSFASYNLRSHHCTMVGDALMTPLQFITGTVKDSLGNLGSYVKPQIANASTTGGPHFAYVGGSDVQGTDQCAMFHIPRDGESILSLAQFSHATLSRPYNVDPHRANSCGEDLEPTYPIGNSMRPSHHPADQLRVNTTGQWDWAPKYSNVPANVGNIYRADTSFLYNNALWDTYYLSGYEPTKEKFLNARLNWENTDAASKAAMNDPLKGLAHVYLDGGFNVNSTSKSAWKALLASTVGIRDSGGGTAEKPAYNRISQSNTAFQSINPGMTASSSESYVNDARMLDEQSLDMLAEHIVEQVKLRGPFPTLAAFVNRSVDLASHARSGLTQAQVCNQGALQAALDGTKGDGSDDVNQMISRSDWVKEGDLNSTWNPYKTTMIGHVYPDAAEGARGYGAPSYLMPSDILSKIGPFLTARSDTFRIQTYGESRDASGKLRARVRCEAIVQRDPQWVGNRLASTEKPVAGSMEERFGRTFRVVSFRWVNEDES